MHQVYIELLLCAIREQYYTEKNFYENQLGVSQEAWENFKLGKAGLANEAVQKMKALFSDYEWMLVQKILRQSVLFPENRTKAVFDYKRLKTSIAQKWIKNNLAEVDMVPYTIEYQNSTFSYIDLKVSITYGEWGYDDILSFRMPASVQQQITSANIPLLDWVSENLAETYH